jgi:hypothetical protein
MEVREKTFNEPTNVFTHNMTLLKKKTTIFIKIKGNIRTKAIKNLLNLIILRALAKKVIVIGSH